MNMRVPVLASDYMRKVVPEWARRREHGYFFPVVALRFLGGVYLPRLIRNAPPPSWMRKALRLCQCACAPAGDNPYMKNMPFPRISLSG